LWNFFYFVTATDAIFENYITSVKESLEEIQQTFTNLQTNGVQAMEGKGATFSLIFLASQLASTRWIQLNNLLKPLPVGFTPSGG
jgi:hypothetical protein